MNSQSQPSLSHLFTQVPSRIILGGYNRMRMTRTPHHRKVRWGSFHLKPEACVASLRADVYLDGRAWDGADAEDLQRVPGSGLFALFYGAAFTGGYFFSVHGDPGGKAGPVGRPLLGDDAVRRPEAVCL